MNKLAFASVSALAFALSACSQAEEAAPVAEETTAAPEPAALMAADGQPPAGTFEVTSSDGTVLTQVVNADGTFTVTAADGTVTTGTMTLEEPNLWCQTDEGETEPTCFAEEVGADGVWNSVNVNDPEDSSTIVRKM